FVQPIPPVPQPSWGPTQIAEGFLAASASFIGKHAAAQQFLSPAARRTFPLGRWPVTVVSGPLTVSTTVLGSPTKGLPVLMRVTLHTTQLATISDIGQYVYGRAQARYQFTLIRTGGQWRISSMAPQALLLTQDSFMDVYQARNLYFWSPNYLSPVPEPVFAPQQDTYAAAAASLVNALLRTSQNRADQQDRTWLAGATQTAFLPGTTLIGNKVTIAGQTAIVNLGGAAAKASSAELQNMAQQLIETLTSTSYSSPAIARHVQLQVNGQLRDSNEPPSPAPAPGPLYYLASNGTVSAWNGAGKAIRNPVGRDQIPFTEIAVLTEPTADTPLLAGAVPSDRGCGIYHGPLAGTAALTLSTVPDARSGPCTSVSWDTQGDIWAATPAGIWVLPAGQQQFLRVIKPLLPGDNLTAYRVLSVRVAPDAVRVAMLVQVESTASAPGGTQVVMAAVSRTQGQFGLGPTVAVGPTLADPVALSWLDPDHLVVLARSELYSVPVNGGVQGPIEPAPAGAVSVTATGPGRIALAGGGQIWTSSGLDQGMLFAVKGTGAAYQG
ncbi:MAG: LpqB family beta-propeller domain-containing protein, partial [Actinomycetota bacterium]|nr:LpqB family beta-propeller domain-containing protein [Actinomycetota bacterium]